MRKCFGPYNFSSGSSSTPATPSPSSPTEGHATKVTKPKERGLRKARSVMGLGLGLRRPSVDSGYGGDVEKTAIPVVVDAVTQEIAVSSSTPTTHPPTPWKERLRTPDPMVPPPKPASATGSLLRRIKSTRLPFRSTTPTAASVFATPPPQPILEGAAEKEVGYSINSVPLRSGTPVPPLMRKLVEGLLVERGPTS